ncbi:type I restriction-modification system subunit M [Herpetosiphon geysericola]|uniref:site-specific DNA-methyltransferase (adenine-specific) n=1 Tax=Herpetosiphon geysericola TaxID=70996 RepID=A0A0P6XCK5_9CHLR|nr:type I restriction-modification system subunit M [Herpetosiphon geysericola]KPL80621.1 type I restriction-modification protein subunit M [Herpetosiphon geysericola]
MALKKSHLYRSLWSSCDALRGGMDASQYKDYVLTLLFMKYVSDKTDSLIEIPTGGSFADMVKLKGQKDIGDQINIIIRRLADANGLRGVIDIADFNDETKLGSGKEMQDKLSKLIGIFEGVDLRANRADGDDLLGDAYEYLMRNFATESGKSKGQFYTPAEVSRVMAKLLGIGADTRPDHTIYDPTCGSGSLLLKVADEAPNGISIYGQEMDNATWALARMNMFLHGYATHELRRGNTLAAPQFKDAYGKLMTFDFAVSNPPFSTKAWSSGFDPLADVFERFAYGVPPEKNGDYAFLLHLIKSLNSRGKGAIILPHGVLFRGNKEGDIRRTLIQQGVIKGIIGLPANLFYGTGIPACILVIDKAHAHTRTGIFMIDASKGFIKDGNKNRLRAQDIHKIVDVFTALRDIPGYSRMVPVSEIACKTTNNYNLNIPRYIDANELEDLHDLDAHLNGGIPNRDLDALAPYWREFPSLRNALFQPVRPDYSQPIVAPQQVKATVLAHPEFQRYHQSVLDVFTAWKAAHAAQLRGLRQAIHPKAVIHALSEDLLANFSTVKLLDRYATYQRLMDYWESVMQDDVYLIAADGWVQAASPRGIIDDAAKGIRETPDLVVGGKKYKVDLIPPALIIARYCQKEQAALTKAQTTAEAAASELEAFLEEYTSEEGLLADALNEKGRLTRISIKDRLKALRADGHQLPFGRDPEEEAEIAALKEGLFLFDRDADATKAVKEAQIVLDRAVLERYEMLAREEAAIQALVVDDKWMATIQAMIVDQYVAAELATITSEVQRVMQQFAQRMKELDERYAHPLSTLEQDVAVLSDRVAAHLKRMGLQWE